MSWSATNQRSRTWGRPAIACATPSRLSAARAELAGVRGDEQDRHRDAGRRSRTAGGPTGPAQHRDVAVEREPRGDRPVVADLEVRERALDAGLRPVGVGRADVALDLARGGARPAAAARASRGTPPSWGTRRTARASHRRRTRSRARAPARGGRAPGRRCRPTTGRRPPAGRAPARGSAAPTSSATVAMSYGPSGLAERPWPRRSTVTARWPRSLSSHATPSHIRAFEASPWTSTNGTASRRGVAGSHVSTASSTPGATGTRCVCIG